MAKDPIEQPTNVFTAIMCVLGEHTTADERLTGEQFLRIWLGFEERPKQRKKKCQNTEKSLSL